MIAAGVQLYEAWYWSQMAMHPIVYLSGCSLIIARGAVVGIRLVWSLIQRSRHRVVTARHLTMVFLLSSKPLRARAIIKDALDTGQRLEMAGSLLDALEGSLRLFEKHRILILGQLLRQPSE